VTEHRIVRLVNYSFDTRNICLKLGQIVTDF
jgi:hypothetical protein